MNPRVLVLITLLSSIPLPIQAEGDFKAATAGKASSTEFVKKLTAIKGLLIMELGPGNYAGKASQMSCTAVASGRSGDKTEAQFNQKVGDDMNKALEEVLKHSILTHGPLPNGHTIDFSFEDKYGDKDGPSAAVACALMLHSLRTGAEIDPAFAVTGDMNADGSVQPVGGVPDKIRGAANRSCTYVGVPAQTEKALMDALLIDGPTGLSGINVFSISKFDDALALASTKKSPQLISALEKFAEIQKVLQTNKTPNLLSNPKVLERLSAVIKDAPNCVSAKCLFLYGSGKLPKTLTLGGSLTQVDKMASELVQNFKQPKPQGLDEDMIARSISNLSRIRTKLDPRVIPYADSIKDYGVEVRNIKGHPPTSKSEYDKVMAKLNQAGGRIEIEEGKIRGNKGWMEEIMR
jgi:hypothetical protein